MIDHTGIATDHPTAARIFADLSKGGAVEMPLAATFWSPAFGMLTDRFGTRWMISLAPQEATP